MLADKHKLSCEKKNGNLVYNHLIFHHLFIQVFTLFDDDTKSSVYFSCKAGMDQTESKNRENQVSDSKGASCRICDCVLLDEGCS